MCASTLADLAYCDLPKLVVLVSHDDLLIVRAYMRFEIGVY
jgi:hypothetical protein